MKADKMKPDRLNFALIGCGRIAQTHLQAISSIPECRLKGVVDINKDAAQNLAHQFKCIAYKDYYQLVNDNQIDAVIICTPPNTHAEITNIFLENGVHVLCEKPFALDSKQARLMLKTAEENNLILMMASKFRYVEDVIFAKSLITSGILGDLILFENVFCSQVNMCDRWNCNKKISGGGVIFDNGSHSVDIARFFLGPIEKVWAEEGQKVQRLSVEETAHIHFKTHSGVQGNIELSWSIYKDCDAYVNIFGTEGKLSIGWKCSKYRQNGKPGWVFFGKGYDKLLAFKRQIKNFAGTIKGEEAPLINSFDGLESVRVIETANRSLSMDKWLVVDRREIITHSPTDLPDLKINLMATNTSI
jgi:predicted dehydrogenase